MPQFDFSVFSEQIFWLLVCFIVLYFFSSKLILPRISLIIESRDSKIKSNSNKAESLKLQIKKIAKDTEELRTSSNLSYKQFIDKTLKECSLDREKSINQTKEKIFNMMKKSEKQISDFINNSNIDYDEAANKIADKIAKKFLGEESSFNGKVEIIINGKLKN